MGEAVPGTIMGTFFFTHSLVDVAMCLSGTEAALSYYRAWPLPIIGTIKNFMIVLLPLLILDFFAKVSAFFKKQTLFTFVGLLNAITILCLFYCISVLAVPSEEAAKEPMTLKGKAKAAAEDKLVEDLYTGAVALFCVNTFMLVLPLVQLGMQAKTKQA